MTDIGKFVPLKVVCSYFLDQYDKSNADFDKVWILALRGLVLMHIQVSAEPKTVRLLVSGNKTVTFPSDCISWSKIGLLNEKGEISSLKINNSLSTYKDTNPNRIPLPVDITDGTSNLTNAPVYFNYYADGNYFNLYGVSNGLIQYGECRVDEKNNLIILPADFAYSSIILEYISSPERDTDYQVETCLQEAIIAFIEWKMKLNTEQNFYARVTEGRRSLTGKKVTLQGINQVIRESNGMKLRS